MKKVMVETLSYGFFGLFVLIVFALLTLIESWLVRDVVSQNKYNFIKFYFINIITLIIAFSIWIAWIVLVSNSALSFIKFMLLGLFFFLIKLVMILLFHNGARLQKRFIIVNFIMIIPYFVSLTFIVSAIGVMSLLFFGLN